MFKAIVSAAIGVGVCVYAIDVQFIGILNHLLTP